MNNHERTNNGPDIQVNYTDGHEWSDDRVEISYDGGQTWGVITEETALEIANGYTCEDEDALSTFCNEGRLDTGECEIEIVEGGSVRCCQCGDVVEGFQAHRLDDVVWMCTSCYNGIVDNVN